MCSERFTARLFQSVVSRRRQKTIKFDIAQKLANYSGNDSGSLLEKLQLGYPFLNYASENWLSHTINFEHSKSKTGSLWTQILLDEQSLGQTPWTHEQFIERDRVVRQWICDENHGALLRLIESSERKVSAEERIFMIRYTSQKGNLALLEIFCEVGHFLPSEIAIALQGAAGGGHLEIVDKLLVAKADVNAAAATHRGRTALQAAAEGGHLEVVDRLLAAKADVNAAAATFGGRTAL